MVWTNGTVTGYKNFLTKIRDFAIRDKEAGAVTPGGGNTGDGIVYGASASELAVVETWTLTCTTLGGNGVAVFSVSGSVSGAQAAATAGVPYSINEIAFTILGGAVDYVGTDSFTFGVTTITPEWTVDNYDTDYDGGGGYELIMHGDGITGTDEIYFGMQTNDAGTGYLDCAAFTGYTSAILFANQPGKQPHSRIIPLFTGLFEYWIWDFKDGIIIVAKVGAVYEHGYFGWVSRLISPSQQQYPIICGASARTTTSYTSQTSDHRAYWNCPALNYTDLTCSILDSNVWVPIQDLSYDSQVRTMPLTGFDCSVPIADPNGDTTSLPALLLNMDTDSHYGEFSGIEIPFTSGGVLTPEDVLVSLDSASICFNDTWRSGILCAIRMG